MSDVVVITGASSGIGRAAALMYARSGRPIGLIARGAEVLEATRRDIEAVGARALALPLDVADDAAVEDAASRVESELGPIGVWVNNAMVNAWGEVLDIPAPVFRRITEVGYLGYVSGTRAALRRMKPRDQGSIVQVGSMISYVAPPLQSAYSGVKHAVRGFTDSVRAELIHAGSGVRLGSVLPASINTPFYDTAGNYMRDVSSRPVPPVYDPALVAQAIRQVAETGVRELFVGGAAEAATVARSLAPHLADQVLARSYRAQRGHAAHDQPHAGNVFQPAPVEGSITGRFSSETWSVSPHFLFAQGRARAEASAVRISEWFLSRWRRARCAVLARVGCCAASPRLEP